MKITKDWIVGFTDGEGCFYVGINPNKTMFNGFQVLPEFRIVQHSCDVKLLFAIRSFFGYGNVVLNKGKMGGNVMEYRVRKLETLSKVIIPFFEANSLLTYKKFDFYIFSEIVRKMSNGDHLNFHGLEEIRRLKSKMNRRQMKIESELNSDIKSVFPNEEEPTY
jgi:hypothetical protein